MISSSTCKRGAIVASAWLTAVLLAAPSLAQPQQGDSIAAQALFKEARALVDAGKWAEGCPKFEGSLALFPSASTMLNIAKCHEHDGKIASAWSDYGQALTLNRETKGEERRRGLEELARKGIAALEPRLPKLRVVVKDAPEGLKVLRDGKEMPAAALAEALPADPGPHEITASAPGYKVETRSVVLEEKKTATVEITLVADAGAPPPSSTAPDQHAAGPGIPVWAWIVGAGGLGLVGAGGFFLADDLSAIHALRANCQSVTGGTACDPDYDYAHDNARKNRGFGLAVGLGGAGLVAIGAAIYGIARGASGKKPAAPAAMVLPWAAPGSAGATITGTF